MGNLALVLRKSRGTCVVLVFLLALPFYVQLWQGANLARSAVYVAIRQYERFLAGHRLSSWELVSGAGVEVRYLPGEEDMARLILDMAKEWYPQVWQEVGFLPGQDVVIAVHPDPISLRAAFGWGPGQEAVGVYKAGVIRLLSPRAWIYESDPEKLEQRFRSQSPLVHELTHFVLDYATNGNYPRWFSEGLAQWQEYRLTGYLWLEPGPQVEDDPYDFATINRRLGQPEHQARAYRQALLMTVFLDQLTQSSGGLTGIISELARGIPLRLAIEDRTGMSFGQYEEAWRSWVRAEDNPWRHPPRAVSSGRQR